jgi:hypothetical protein
MKRVSLAGVATGNITDILATNAVLLPVMFYILAAASTGSLSENALRQILANSQLIIIASGVVGGLCSVLGGYVAARIAKHDHVLNGSLSSILCTAGGLYSLIHGSALGHSWVHLAFLPLSPALGALGGFLCLHRNAPQ